MTVPGWYPDPILRGTERWFDGTAWTGATRPVASPVPVRRFTHSREAKTQVRAHRLLSLSYWLSLVALIPFLIFGVLVLVVFVVVLVALL